MARIRKPKVETGPAPTMKKLLWKIAIYIRLSREDGNDESNSVVNQRKIAEEFIEKKFDGDCIVIDKYIDDGLTGTDDSRADFQRMIKDIETGKVNCIVTKSLSRAFRNYADQGYYLESYFPFHATRFVTIADSVVIDTYINPEVVHNFEVPITGVMNDRYAYKTSVDVRATFRTKRIRGEFIGAFAPYGYKKDPENKNKLLIDEEAARVIRDIFIWFIRNGMSINGIVFLLNERGIPNPTAYKHSHGFHYNNPNMKNNDGFWNHRTVRQILKSKMYIGTMVQGQQRVINYKVHDRIAPPQEEWYVVPGTHEGIVTEEEFEAVQRLLAQNTRTAPQQKNVHMLSGFVFCADCKKGMTRKAANGYVYFACRTYSQKSKTRCTKHAIREDMLKQAVLVAIQKQIALIASLAEVIENINKAPQAQAEPKRLSLLLKQRTAELERNNNTIDGLYTDWKNGDLTREEYLRLKAGLTEKLNKIQVNIRSITEEIQTLSQGVRSDVPFLLSFLKYKNITRLERGLMVELIDAIYVYENKEIQIDFNFADQYQRALNCIEMNHREQISELTLIKGIGY